MNIKFSPPDIGQAEIDEVVDTLKSGWITTGAKTKKFENEISKFCNTDKTVCLNSATAALELTLRILGIGAGDEVITSAYTYTASASVVAHIGAKLVLIDTAKDSYEMDYALLSEAITERTKAIIPIDIAGVLCDYDKIFEIVNSKKSMFTAMTDLQKSFGRIIVLADGAHSFGAAKNDKKSGEFADFTTFSFHAVKNLTTGEGGAVTWKNFNGIDSENIYKQYQLLSLHGQSKDALAKTQIGAWEYDIIDTFYKCNMTDITASIGLAQLSRYNGLLKRRKEIIRAYNNAFDGDKIEYIDHSNSSGHLYLTRIKGISVKERNQIIIEMAEKGIACNVHYKPLPMMTAYKNLGFDIKDFPVAYKMYENEITLPLHTKLTNEEIAYIIENYKRIVESF